MKRPGEIKEMMNMVKNGCWEGSITPYGLSRIIARHFKFSQEATRYCIHVRTLLRHCNMVQAPTRCYLDCHAHVANDISVLLLTKTVPSLSLLKVVVLLGHA
jgi:hypothetical protein